MEIRLCEKTAFAYHRLPPAMREVWVDMLEGIASGRTRRIPKRGFGDIVPLPLHVMVDERSRRFSSKGFICHHRSAELPSGSVWEIGRDVYVSSPALSLLEMTPRIGLFSTLMIMYEFCGTFSVFRPPIAIAGSEVPWGSMDFESPESGWRCVRDIQGDATDLWKRPPLCTAAFLREFAELSAGVYGASTFRRAASLTLDGAASPFEVQAALLFGLSRRLGGADLHVVGLNTRIPLDRGARVLSGRGEFFGDILLEGPSHGSQVIVECQSRLVHDSGERSIADSVRLGALQSMGYLVVPVTFEQIVHPDRFRELEKCLRRELKLPNRAATTALERKRTELRADLFIDWIQLGS